MAGYTDNPTAQLHAGKYTNGDPLAGIPASRIMAEQANNLVDEINNVVLAAGGTPNFSESNQLVAAINTLLSSLVVPTSSGATTIIYGYPQCSDFTVALPPLVDGRIYRFIPHATNHATVATTLNGKPLTTYSHETVGVVSEVIGARYKALRPGYIAEVLYRASDDVFIVLNPRESELLHFSIVVGLASGVTSNGWPYTRLSTGIYEISTGIGRNGRLLAQMPTGDFIANCGTLGTAGTFQLQIRDFNGALSNTSGNVSLFLVL